MEVLVGDEPFFLRHRQSCGEGRDDGKLPFFPR